MKKIKLLLLISISILMFNSCKKDKSDPSKSEMLTGKNWINTSMTIDPAVNINGTLYTNLLSLMQDCSKDDLQKFETNGVYVFDEGATKCDNTSPQTTTGTWTFNSDQTVVSVTQNGTTTSVTLQELTSSTMKGSYQVTEDFGSGALPYTITFTSKVK